MGEAIDLTGQTFGELSVIDRNYTYGKENNLITKNDIYWNCECSCGEKIVSTTKRLRAGRTSRCKKCAYKKRNEENYPIMLNKRFNRLVVIEQVERPKHITSHGTYWKCLCDCGNTIITSQKGLMSGDSQSCGCLHKELSSKNASKNLINKKYGKLTVIEQDFDYRKRYEINNPRLYWKCLCECGNIKTFSSNALEGHKVFSCGCLLIKSKGETRIQEILEQNKVSFLTQYYDERMRLTSNRRPRFDFAITKDDKVQFLLEYNGIQHYSYEKKSRNSWNNEENFIKTQDRDFQKIEICNKLNLPLEIISYKDYSKLEDIIKKLLIKYNII